MSESMSDMQYEEEELEAWLEERDLDREVDDLDEPDIRCGFCYQPPEDHTDSDAGPMTVCPAWALAKGRDMTDDEGGS